MDNNIDKINVEEIMAEIKRDIKEKGYKNDDISFSEVMPCTSYTPLTHSNMLDENVRNLMNIRGVVSYKVLKSNRSIGFIIIFVKKIIRKLVKFYIEPIVYDQNQINSLAAISIKDIYMEVESLRKNVEFLEEEIDRLKKTQ